MGHLALMQMFYTGKLQGIWWAGMAEEQEWSLSTNVAQFWFQPGAICGLSLLLVVPLVFVLCVFLPPKYKRPTFPNSNSAWIEDPYENQLHCTYREDMAFSLNIVIYLSFIKMNIFMYSVHPLYTLLLITNLGITKNIVRFLAKPPLLKGKAAG